VGDVARLYKDAAELVALRPEVILAGVGGTVAALQQASRTVPIVYAQGIDPVGNGYAESLARPGGNATGFIQFEYGLAGKWVELLKEIAPGIPAWVSCANLAPPPSDSGRSSRPWPSR
jgi:putative ABC transport system substrate-binding protein